MGFVERVGRQAMQIPFWDEQSIGTLLWALAVLRHQDTAATIVRFCRIGMQNARAPPLREWTALGLCSLAWVTGALRSRGELAMALAKALREVLQTIPTDRLSPIATAYAMLWPCVLQLKASRIRRSSSA